MSFVIRWRNQPPLRWNTPFWSPSGTGLQFQPDETHLDRGSGPKRAGSWLRSVTVRPRSCSLPRAANHQSTQIQASYPPENRELTSCFHHLRGQSPDPDKICISKFV